MAIIRTVVRHGRLDPKLYAVNVGANIKNFENPYEGVGPKSDRIEESDERNPHKY
jgi:hypothetical protein